MYILQKFRPRNIVIGASLHSYSHTTNHLSGAAATSRRGALPSLRRLVAVGHVMVLVEAAVAAVDGDSGVEVAAAVIGLVLPLGVPAVAAVDVAVAGDARVVLVAAAGEVDLGGGLAVVVAGPVDVADGDAAGVDAAGRGCAAVVEAERSC